MADSLNSGNILTTQIGGNVVSIDPNKIVGSDGVVKDRLVNQEDFVMYANLTAKIFPRSKLLVGAAAGDEISVEIADGELNFLKPKGKNSFDSDWTDAFTDPDVNQKIKTQTKEGVTISQSINNQNDFQGFGITSISIKINASYIPQVTINFTDVRGKTLFEQAKVNTPYTAFFHLPYPTFFLTLKGYYGKAVQYQLTLEKFISRFDPSSGDYLVTCDFKGNHIAMLRDINMHEAVTAPYMYPTRQDASTGTIQMTKGRQVLGEVYREYYTKGLIGDNLYDKKYTIVELIEKIQSIDNDMSQVFGKANLQSTTHKLEYEETLEKFKEAVTGKKGWVGKYLDTSSAGRRNVTVEEPPYPPLQGQPNPPTPNTGRTIVTNAYPLKGMSAATAETDPTKRKERQDGLVDDAKNALGAIVKKYFKLLQQNPTFKARSKVDGGKYSVATRFSDPTYDIFESSKITKSVKIGGITTQLPTQQAPWFMFEGSTDSFMFIWTTTKRIFDAKAKTMAENLSEELNGRLQKAIGFKPTIRNVFAIILAGADTFLKLLDDVHTEAFSQRQNEQRLAVAVSSNDSNATNQIVYPWPQYYKIEEEEKGGNCTTTNSVLTYPGANEVIANTLGNDQKIWPEVAFVEEYTKATNYKFSFFSPPVENTGIDKDFTPITVYDWLPIDTPYSSLEDLDIWFEILDRAQRAVLNGGLISRYAGQVGATPSTIIGEGIVELGKYDALNLYQRIKSYSTQKQVFMDLGGLGQMLTILKDADPSRFRQYQLYGTITPYTIKGTFTLNYKPNRFTVVPQSFEQNTKVLLQGKTNGMYDLAPCIYGAWVRNNFANAKGVSQNDFFDISKNVQYEINEKNVLTDTWSTQYLTRAKYITSNFIDLDQEKLIERKNNSNALNTLTTANEAYESFAEHKFITEGEIHGSPTVSTIPGGGTNTELAAVRLTSMLNTPYFMNALTAGAEAEKAGTFNAYTQAAYLFLNSLPLPTLREKVIYKKEDNDEFGNYISQMFNQMPAIHNLPIAFMLRIGSVWWRYKTEVQTQLDPLNTIWGNIGVVTQVGYTGPDSIYETPLNTTNYYTFVASNDGVTSSGPYPYVSHDNTVANTIMQVGVYPKLIDTINFIATNSTNYNNIGAGQLLNNLLDATGNAPLTIEPNSNINYKSFDNVDVKFYSVYLRSTNIAVPALGVTTANSPDPGGYTILFPSSGGLNQTDASTYETPTYGNPALHNGASRILWGASNYGYFEHRPTYQSTPGQYFKKINPEQNEQEDWSFSEQSIYDTIEVLRGVFNTEQLDAFEQEFLTFSTPGGSSTLGGSLKELIRELVVVEDSWVSMVGDLSSMSIIPNSKELAEAQMLKFNTTMFQFLNKKVEYIHRSTTNLDLVVNNQTLLEKLQTIHSINNNLWQYDATSDTSNGESPFENLTELYGSYANGLQIPTSGNFFIGNPIEYQTIRLEVGEFYTAVDPQFSSLVPADDTNPIYKFFKTINKPNSADGMEFNVANIIDFAPFIKLYASYCSLNGTTIPANEFLNQFITEIDSTQGSQELYISTLLEEVKKNIKQNLETDNTTINVVTDDRPEVKSDDIKLELYNQFKTINDRWVSGTNLTDQTLFEKFLFLDRANQDIGDQAIINIWDILQLDSPFTDTNSKTLTQSVSSYLSIILANNYFNFIPLPSYINFFNIEKKGTDTQAQGNAMFGTFKTVDYIDSAPAFLCQYVGKPSSQLNVKTPNNGYNGDSFNYNSPNSPLVTQECGNKEQSNKVMGFNVDFGIPNQNIFESITLDQSQFQNTSESFKVLQSMADSGGGNATSPASASLFNVYASRSYTARITCVGNVTIQPTQYFQLRYLPMFNGPYLIINVEHEIRPNNIETTFEGVRVPRPSLPAISDLVQRVNVKLYEKAEDRLDKIPIDLYYDGLSATESQKKLQVTQNDYIATGVTYQTPPLNDDNVTWVDVTLSAGTFIVTPNEDPEKRHLGVDICPTSDNAVNANSENGGIDIYPSVYGVVTKVVDGCKPLQESDGCSKYGNHVEIKTNINVDPVEEGTAYYLTRYAFLREGITVNLNDSIQRGSVGPGMGNKVLGKMGNSGLSKDTHLHFEIKRGVKQQGKIIEHYLNPAEFLPRTRQ
jgi:hypothetical protein